MKFSRLTLMHRSIREWLSSINIEQPQRAHLICRVIPAQCPFERDITLFGKVFHIPPLCHLNPFYEEFTLLRFRALGYLADVCGEDVTKYCH